MSDSPESKKPNPNAVSNPVGPQPGASPAPSGTTAGTNGQPAAQFQSSNIGSWASRQEDFFAEQNRQAEEKRQKSERTRKKVLPVAIIAGGIVAAGLIIWGIVALIIAITTEPPAPDVPTIAGGTTEDISDYSDVLQEFFNKDGGNNLAAVEEAVNNTLGTNNGKEYADQVRLAELYILQNNGYYAEAVDKAQAINVDNLDLNQKISFYGVLYYCNTLLGNAEAANEYMKIQYELSQQQGGQGGGGGA